MILRGVDIVVVELLGHSLKTARRYALPTRKDREDAIAPLTGDAQAPVIYLLGAGVQRTSDIRAHDFGN